MMKVGHREKSIHYLAVNWVLLCIADPLEQRCFTGICPPNNEDTEMSVLGSDFRSFFWVSRYRWYTGCWISWGQRIRWRYSNNRWRRIQAGRMHTLRSPSENLPQAFVQSLGLFVRWAFSSHINEGRKESRWVIHKACNKPEPQGIYNKWTPYESKITPESVRYVVVKKCDQSRNQVDPSPADAQVVSWLLFQWPALGGSQSRCH